MGLALAVFTSFLTHNRGHLLGFLLFLKFLVVFLPGAFTGLADTLLLLEIILSLLFLHVFDRIEALDECSHLTFLLTLEQFGNLQALGSSDLCFFALSYLFDSLEG